VRKTTSVTTNRKQGGVSTQEDQPTGTQLGLGWKTLVPQADGKDRVI
jgi:hypothetical protein